jgi:rod shape-determining protein MreC
MQQIIEFFIRNKNFLLFLALFSLGISLTQRAHSGLYTRNIASTNKITGTIFTWLSNARSYLALRQKNEELVAANLRLLALLDHANSSPKDSIPIAFEGYEVPQEMSDSLLFFRPKIIQAHVINNSYHRLKNTLTIDKGSTDGVVPDMGVASPMGIVGIITHVSEHFSVAQSILNTSSRVVVKSKKSDHFGTLIWDGGAPDQLLLTEIPKIAPLAIGDSLVTDGKSTIFPRGWPVGTVTDINPAKAQDYLDVSVRPHTDMSSIYHVYLIQRQEAKEIRELEKLSQNEL